MDCNACSTRLLLHWMKDACSRTTFPEKLSLLLERFRFVILKFSMNFAVPARGFQIRLEDQTQLYVNAAFQVCNLQQRVASTHREIERAWGLQWDSMQQQLQVPWASAGLSLQSVLEFALTAVRVRREQAKSVWKGKNADLLEVVQRGLIDFLASIAQIVVNQDHASFESPTLPKRRSSRPDMKNTVLTYQSIVHKPG